VFDGDVDPEWVENLNRYVSLSRQRYRSDLLCPSTSTFLAS
jgi:hypothetical protein